MDTNGTFNRVLASANGIYHTCCDIVKDECGHRGIKGQSQGII